jgi:hypothetical protein
MNLQAINWLLRHRDVLVKAIRIGSKFNKSLTYIEQWVIIDEIARLLIPALEADTVKPQINDLDFIEPEDYEVQLLLLGGELQSLNIDWKHFIEAVLPLIVAILEMLLKK